MRVIEQLCRGKSSKRPCEDGLFINDHFIAVIDGCSSSNSLFGQTQTNGVIAKNLLLNCLSNLAKDATSDEVFYALNQSIYRWYEDHDVTEKVTADATLRPSAYIAMISRHHRQVWILGDCQALIDTIHYTKAKPIDSLMELNRVLLIEEALIQGYSQDELLANPEIIQDQLAKYMAHQASFQNQRVGVSHFGYPTLDGFFEHYESILVVDLPRKPTEVVLASDGYPSLCSTLNESEERLKAIIENDPLLYTDYRSTKGVNRGYDSFDDRTYVRFWI